MRITENRLRKIIRQVIKENYINEIEGMGMDSYAGAAAHSTHNALMQTVYPEEFYGSDPSEFPEFVAAGEAVGLTSNLIGMLMMATAGSVASFGVGAAISAGGALYMMIDNYLKHGSIAGEPQFKKEIRRAQQRIERECPECLDDVR